MNLTRRYFLQTTGMLGASVGIAPILTMRRSMAAVRTTVAAGRTLVVIFLRGGADGLSLVVPYGDPALAGLRKRTAIPEPGRGNGRGLDLDGYFSLNPRLAPLLPHFNSGLAVAAHAVGYDGNSRSHFEEQDVWETGMVSNTIHSDGWLNRHLATSTSDAPIRAISIGDSLPRILRGKAASFAVRGVEDLTLPPVPGVDPDVVAKALERAYCTEAPQGAARELLARTAGSTLEGMRQLRDLTAQPYEPKTPYPNSELGRRLMQIARLIKADVGLEVAEVDFNGWDTHQNQGSIGGAFGGLAAQLGAAIDAFVRDLDDRMKDVVVVTLSDFGRTAAENGTGGTDHGWGNCMFLLGGAVMKANRAADGDRRVVADWPGLAEDQLHQGRDLLHTTDFRDVLAELVSVHLGNPNLEQILPGLAAKPPGLVVR